MRRHSHAWITSLLILTCRAVRGTQNLSHLRVGAALRVRRRADELQLGVGYGKRAWPSQTRLLRHAIAQDFSDLLEGLGALVRLAKVGVFLLLPRRPTDTKLNVLPENNSS